MKPQSITSILAVAAIAASALFGQDFGPGGFGLTWNTIDCGGETLSTGGSFQLAGTIGQHDAGESIAGGVFELSGGFWPGAAAPTSLDPCLPDLTGDLVVNVDDLLTIINGWGACPAPP